MIVLNGYDDVQAVMPGKFPSLPAGGYVCKIINVEITKSKAGNDMLVLYVDIIEGDFAGYFKSAADRVKKFDASKRWDNSAIYRQLIFDRDGKVSKFFKGLLTCISKSNQSFRINPLNFDEQSLRGLLIGIIFADEEYLKRDGSVGSRTFAKFPESITKIREGAFSVPSLKKLDKPASRVIDNDWQGSPIDPDDTPF